MPKPGGPFSEPRLKDVLEDPLTRLVMRSDGVSRAALEALIAEVAGRLREAAAAPA